MLLKHVELETVPTVVEVIVKQMAAYNERVHATEYVAMSGEDTEHEAEAGSDVTMTAGDFDHEDLDSDYVLEFRSTSESSTRKPKLPKARHRHPLRFSLSHPPSVTPSPSPSRQSTTLLASSPESPEDVIDNITTLSAQAGSHLRDSEQTNEFYESAVALMQVLQTINHLLDQLAPDEYDTILLTGPHHGQKMLNVLAAEMFSINIQLCTAFSDLGMGTTSPSVPLESSLRKFLADAHTNIRTLSSHVLVFGALSWVATGISWRFV